VTTLTDGSEPHSLSTTFFAHAEHFELNGESRRGYVFLSRPAGPVGSKEATKGESPAAPLVMEMARAVIGQKGDDTSIITPNLDLASMQPTAISQGLRKAPYAESWTIERLSVEQVGGSVSSGGPG
jgi:hypothetical protein